MEIMTKEQILETHCPSMNNLYLDGQGRDFKDRILDAMEQYKHSNPLRYFIASYRPNSQLSECRTEIRGIDWDDAKFSFQKLHPNYIYIEQVREITNES